jgi:hypothetical protein
MCCSGSRRGGDFKSVEVDQLSIGGRMHASYDRISSYNPFLLIGAFLSIRGLLNLS